MCASMCAYTHHMLLQCVCYAPRCVDLLCIDLCFNHHFPRKLNTGCFAENVNSMLVTFLTIIADEHQLHRGFMVINVPFFVT